MRRQFLLLGGFSMLIAVMLGAMGAHGLKESLIAHELPLDLLDTWETGARYQVYHALALILLGAMADKLHHKLFAFAGWFMVAGTVLFSGSLYLLSARHQLGMEGMTSVLGPITPIGGLMFIVAWILFLVGVIKLRKK